MSLQGRVALVTGGGTGLGLMMAKGFASNGAKVYITGRRKETLLKATEVYQDLQGKILPLPMDVTSETSIQEAVNFLEAAEGRLDILVNNAGTGGPSSDPSFFDLKIKAAAANEDIMTFETQAIWAEVLATNTTAPFFVTRGFTSLLIKGAEARNASSSIINISSIGAKVKPFIYLLSLAYGVSKAGLDKLSKNFATDFAQRKIPIRVNVIHPGPFPSEVATKTGADATGLMGKAIPALVEPVPLKRGGREEEIVSTAMYLATCEFTNGAEISVDGGVALVNP